MDRLHRSKTGNFVGPTFALLLVVYMGLAPAITASAQRISEAVSVAVVPFVERTGHQKELIADKATDAAALALDESQEYVITPKSDTEDELAAMGVVRGDRGVLAISEQQMVRLGERLRVEKVARGSVDRLTISKNGAGSCTLTIRLLDVALQTYLEGASGTYVSRGVPGWTGDRTAIINELLRSAAEDAVRKIQTSRRPRGNIDMVDSTGQIIVNLGFRDGIEIGMELLVVRGVWNAATEVMVLRRLGVIVVKQVEVNMCRCAPVSGQIPRTADKCYVMYRPTKSLQVAAASKSRKKNITMISALLLGLGIIGTALGPSSQTAPGAQAFLSQDAPGAEPRIRVLARYGNIPGTQNTHAWMVYRGQRRGFPAEVDDRNHLIAAVRGSRLAYFEDDTSRQVSIAFDLEFNYLDEAGEEQDGTVDIVYNHTELVAGQAFYYKLRRVVDPGRVRIPIATAQIQQPLGTVTFTIDPTESMSEESPPAGPVTFFFPALPETPSDGNRAVDPGVNRTVFTWTTSVGADQYQIRIYKNPQATGPAVKMSPALTHSGTPGGTMNWRMNTALSPSTDYYWFVGARRSLEGAPRVESNNSSGWVLSAPFAFTTAPSPPPTPSGAPAGIGGRARPSTPRGIFHESPMPGRKP